MGGQHEPRKARIEDVEKLSKRRSHPKKRESRASKGGRVRRQGGRPRWGCNNRGRWIRLPRPRDKPQAVANTWVVEKVARVEVQPTPYPTIQELRWRSVTQAVKLRQVQEKQRAWNLWGQPMSQEGRGAHSSVPRARNQWGQPMSQEGHGAHSSVPHLARLRAVMNMQCQQNRLDRPPGVNG